MIEGALYITKIITALILSTERPCRRNIRIATLNGCIVGNILTHIESSLLTVTCVTSCTVDQEL